MTVPHVATAIAAGAVAGLGSVPHCMGMCGPLVAGVCSGPRDGVSYQVGRTLSYGALGGLSGSLVAAGTSPLSAELAATVTSMTLALGLLWVAARLVRSAWPRTASAAPLLTLKTKEAAEATQARASAPAAPGRWARLVRPVLRYPLLVGVASAVLPCAALVNMGVLAGATGSPVTGAVAGLAFATTTGGGLATSVWASTLLRETRAGSLVVAAVLVLGAGIVSARALPLLSGEGAGSAAPACHTDASVAVPGGPS
ncbi:MAG: sulfite exporter TauE/SafE family protein [Myxococcales bacterium]|nr:sulfite exporter TauE/SafE family protein [Myxococcales bacterium]